MPCYPQSFLQNQKIFHINMKTTVYGWLLFILFFISFQLKTAHAQDDVAGSGDHPMIERVSGSYIYTFDSSEYERIEFPTGPADSDGFESAQTAEGEHLQFSYRFEEEDVSTMRVKSSYRQALEQAGFEILFAGSEDELGYRNGYGFFNTGEFSRSDRRCCTPNTRSHDIRYLAARSQDGSVTMNMLSFRAQLGMGTVALVETITKDVMETAMGHQPLSADEMGSGLEQHGRVAVQNILFDIDSDDILPESAEALETIAGLMEDQPGLNLLVVGHTDNTGNFDYNLSLSMQRASSVVAYLTEEFGIAEDRLQSAGAGMMAPITTNRTEEGRALNRRVELVEISH